MKRLLTLLFVCSLLFTSFSKGNELRVMESLSFYSKILGQDVKYSICLPVDYYKSNKSYPVVYMLHGLGDDETAWLEYGKIYQIADKAVKDKEIVSMIFVIPQGFRTYYVNDYAGTFRYQDMFVQELIPFIDSHYRTKADRIHRATLGYSMGGFGALIIPLKNPDLISTGVPLSISIRTDSQYMAEDGSEWDKQWGSLFGGVGKVGEERLTDYFKQNYPFHIFAEKDLSKLKDLRIYIDNGDDEKTLCRSNEELHILLRDIGFPHEFRVRNGGHEFAYWRDALPNGLRFISDAFESKVYRGDIKLKPSSKKLIENQLQKLSIGNNQLFAFLPLEYNVTNRLYPVVYFTGTFSSDELKSISECVNSEIENGNVSPMVVVFVQNMRMSGLKELLPSFEEKLRIRNGYRYRALIGYRDVAQDVLKQVLIKEQFGSCILMDASIAKDSISKLVVELNAELFKRTSLFIDAPDKGKYYEGNGNAHMLLRDKELPHEYRVRDGEGGFTWMLLGVPEILSFADKRFHR